MVQNLEDNNNLINESISNNENVDRFDFFKSDKTFYTVLIITVVVFIILGIILLTCLICKPSYWKEVDFTSHPMEFLQDSNRKIISRSEFTVTNTTINKTETVNVIVENDNPIKSVETPVTKEIGNISTLSTNLPPLMSKTNNHLKPKEIKKLRNALDKIESHEEGSVFRSTKKVSYNDLDHLDITSLTHMDDGFD